MQYQTAYSHILITFRQFKTKHIVHLVNLQSCRKEIVTIIGFLSHILGSIVLIFNISEDFLNDIFQTHQTAGTAKLIYNDT